MWGLGRRLASGRGGAPLFRPAWLRPERAEARSPAAAELGHEGAEGHEGRSGHLPGEDAAAEGQGDQHDIEGPEIDMQGGDGDAEELGCHQPEGDREADAGGSDPAQQQEALEAELHLRLDHPERCCQNGDREQREGARGHRQGGPRHRLQIGKGGDGAAAEEGPADLAQEDQELTAAKAQAPLQRGRADDDAATDGKRDAEREPPGHPLLAFEEAHDGRDQRHRGGDHGGGHGVGEGLAGDDEPGTADEPRRAQNEHLAPGHRAQATQAAGHRHHEQEDQRPAADPCHRQREGMPGGEQRVGRREGAGPAEGADDLVEIAA